MATKKQRKQLTREDILGLKATDYLEKREVYIEEFGGSVWVRELTALEQRRASRVTGDEDFGPGKMLALCVVNAEGEQIFSEADAEAIMKQGGKVLKKIIDEITAINGVTAEMIADFEKNSESARSDGSSTDSPSVSGAQ